VESSPAQLSYHKGFEGNSWNLHRTLLPVRYVFPITLPACEDSRVLKADEREDWEAYGDMTSKLGPLVPLLNVRKVVEVLAL